MFLEKYGILALFILIALEYACFPLPSEIVLPLSGILAAKDDISFISILSISVIAGLIGSTICYFIGLFGGNGVINILSIYFPKFRVAIDKAKNKYDEYRNVSISLGRLVPVCRTYISFIAGINHHFFPSYLFFSAIGILVWNTFLVSLGYYTLENISDIKAIYNEYKIIILIVIMIYLIYRILINEIKKKKNSEN